MFFMELGIVIDMERDRPMGIPISQSCLNFLEIFFPRLIELTKND